MSFKSQPFHLLVCLLFAFFFGEQLPFELIRGAYTLSCVFKEILLAFLPLVIFSYISTAILSLDKKAPFLILAIILLVTFSNVMAVCSAFGIAAICLPGLNVVRGSPFLNATQQLSPFFNLDIPCIVSADRMLVLALIFGLVFSFFKSSLVEQASSVFHKYITSILVKVLMPFLPLYILGFVLKMSYEGGLAIIFKSYGQVFFIICLAMLTYITLLYAVGQGFRFQRTVVALRNMLPAGLTGFSTMSSAVTMPVTLACTEKNMQDRHFAHLIIPTTVNIHMVGDAISVPILTFGIMQFFGQPLPDIETFLLFVPAFCLAKFSLAAIPGGTIIVMLPILQTHFHLSSEAAGLITTLYILQDPLFTSGNVMGNGAFAIISHKLIKKITNLHNLSKSSCNHK